MQDHRSAVLTLLFFPSLSPSRSDHSLSLSLSIMLTLRTRALSASATARAARHAAGALHTLCGQTSGATAAATSSTAALLHRPAALPLPRAVTPVTAIAAVRSSLHPSSSGCHRSLHTSSSLRLSSSDKDAPPPGPGDGDDAVPPEEDDNEHEQSVEATADEDAEGKEVDGGDENEDINSLLGGEDAEGFDAEAAEAAEDADEPPQNLVSPTRSITGGGGAGGTRTVAHRSDVCGCHCGAACPVAAVVIAETE